MVHARAVRGLLIEAVGTISAMKGTSALGMSPTLFVLLLNVARTVDPVF